MVEGSRASAPRPPDGPLGAPPEHPLLQPLWAPLVEIEMRRVHIALQLAVLLALDFPLEACARRLGIRTAEVREVLAHLQQVAPQLLREDRATG